MHEREIRASQTVGTARDVDRAAFLAAVDDLLAEGPLAQPDLAAGLVERFPGFVATQLGQLARSMAPLVQAPPRGTWRGSGGAVYQRADTWTGLALVAASSQDVVLRYLRAFGPGSAADVTAWSGVTRLVPIVSAMVDVGELVGHEDANGRALFDVPDGELEPEDAPAPVRLLGRYDNLWLSHARRDRVTAPAQREAWSGVNGGVAHTLFADGMLEGLWSVENGRVRVLETLRPLSRRERSELDDEIARVEALLARD